MTELEGVKVGSDGEVSGVSAPARGMVSVVISPVEAAKGNGTAPAGTRR